MIRATLVISLDNNSAEYIYQLDDRNTLPGHDRSLTCVCIVYYFYSVTVDSFNYFTNHHCCYTFLLYCFICLLYGLYLYNVPLLYCLSCGVCLKHTHMLASGDLRSRSAVVLTSS